MKFVVELWNNVTAENEELFLRNQKMLATNIHIMDKKVSMGYWKRKSQYDSFSL